MSIETRFVSIPDREVMPPARTHFDLFLISALLLFLELACIRWFPAHVLFLTFFTNAILIACFLGMSVGCLAASRASNFLFWTPPLIAMAMGTAHIIEYMRPDLEKILRVGNPNTPQHVFFGVEYFSHDPVRFVVPIEVVEGFFFLVIALVLVGLGQELGRALNRLPSRLHAYTLNISGSVVGIVLFAIGAWWGLSTFWWFLSIVIALGYLLFFRPTALKPVTRLAMLAPLGAILWLASLTSGPYAQHGLRPVEHFWSPYYRIDYVIHRSSIAVNLLSHQQMVSRSDHSSPAYAYALPHLLNRDSGGRPFQDVLIIGAGSGNDVSRALQWGARRIDAVEIDPVILRLGLRDHPDRPYQDARVVRHLDDGRNFLRATDQRYDLIVYALVDSLVLHSSYSNIRLESYLFTRQAFADVRRHLKPAGQFVMYNYFRQGWIVSRIHQALTETFGAEPLVLTLPYQATIWPESMSGFTMLIAGSTDRLRSAFQAHPEYWLPADHAPGPDSPNGFEQPRAEEGDRRIRFGPATLVYPEKLRTATDDWPFLYLRRPMIPDLSLRGMAIMGGLALLLLFLFLPKAQNGKSRFAFDGRMFFLGAGFMLVETKAVVHMALLFGSTWMVNTIVFLAVLMMILAANLFVLRVRPKSLALYYAGLLATLGLNSLVPLDAFLGLNRALQILGSCLLVFTPILFAGVIFAIAFARSTEPDRDFGANIAGAICGGLTEYSSMLLGFQYLMLVAVVFYSLSAVVRLRRQFAGVPSAAPEY